MLHFNTVLILFCTCWLLYRGDLNAFVAEFDVRLITKSMEKVLLIKGDQEQAHYLFIALFQR